MLYPFKKPKFTPVTPAATTPTAGPTAKRPRIETTTSESGRWLSTPSYKKFSCDHLNILNPDIIAKFPIITAAYTTSTWNKLHSAKNCFNKFEKETNTYTSWPIPAMIVNKFCNWALTKTKLKTSRVESYLGSLCTLHKLNNLDDSGFHNFICKTMLRGAENLEVYKTSFSKPRYVMTLETLKILGHQIASLEWNVLSKQILWATCCVAFFWLL